VASFDQIQSNLDVLIEEIKVKSENTNDINLLANGDMNLIIEQDFDS
jgi:hypothetical protein